MHEAARVHSARRRPPVAQLRLVEPQPATDGSALLVLLLAICLATWCVVAVELAALVH